MYLATLTLKPESMTCSHKGIGPTHGCAEEREFDVG
jgi:hypothetical protein